MKRKGVKGRSSSVSALYRPFWNGMSVPSYLPSESNSSGTSTSAHVLVTLSMAMTSATAVLDRNGEL